MNDVQKVIRLLKARTDELDANSAIYVAIGDRGRQAFYKAQSDALKAFAAELAAAAAPAVERHAGDDCRSVLITEMGGQMTARVVARADGDAIADQFATEHRALLDEGGHGQWELKRILIPPLDRVLGGEAGVLDLRYVFIAALDGRLDASIHNTLADLEATESRFELRYAEELEDQEVSRYSHEILIPPRRGASDPVPF